MFDFTNTVDWHSSNHPEDRIENYVDLLLWSKKAGLLTERETNHFYKQSEKSPAKASSALRRMVRVRETIYRILSANTKQLEPSAADLEYFNGELARFSIHLRIVSGRNQFEWDWIDYPIELDSMLGPIIKLTADLLTSDQLGKVKECANEEEGCGWLFLDATKNSSRRWCSICGNRLKFRRYYERNKQDKQI